MCKDPYRTSLMSVDCNMMLGIYGWTNRFPWALYKSSPLMLLIIPTQTKQTRTCHIPPHACHAPTPQSPKSTFSLKSTLHRLCSSKSPFPLQKGGKAASIATRSLLKINLHLRPLKIAPCSLCIFQPLLRGRLPCGNDSSNVSRA